MESSLPPNDFRPLQFVPPFEQWCGTSDDAIRLGLQGFSRAGIGGIVVSVSLERYLRDDSAWVTLRRGVQIAHEMGFRIWVYDEKGYPSGAAGGLVLEQLPDAEAQGLIRSTDSGGETRFEVVTLYEGTHATNNFYEDRRYPNILDPDAVAAFIAATHDRYARALQPIGEYVEAFFTDEPSLISAHVPTGKTFPQTLPWHPWLPDLFRFRKGYDLLPRRESLFRDTGEIDRKVRCDFYEVIADLCAETYFGQIREWCRRHEVASSGHLLGEESMVWQTLFNGDPFPCYRRFDIPGIDMILSDPGKIMGEGYFLVPKLASSAARLQGKRRVMCEISDFLDARGGRRVTLDQMKSTAGLLSALGVTDFVSMYPAPLTPERAAVRKEGGKRFSEVEYREYSDYVARVSALLSSGRISTRIAVVYPLLSIWAHFTPPENSMYEPHPDPHVRMFDRAFTDLCRSLLAHQMDFDIVDEKSLAEARIEGATIVMGEMPYDLILFPPMDTVHLQTMETVARFIEQGGTVCLHGLVPKYAAEGVEHDGDVQALTAKILAGRGGKHIEEDVARTPALLESRVSPNCILLPASPHILCILIYRSGEPTYFLVNTQGDKYRGRCTFPSLGAPFILDPATGEEREIEGTKTGDTATSVELTLNPLQSLFAIFRPSPGSGNP